MRPVAHAGPESRVRRTAARFGVLFVLITLSSAVALGTAIYLSTGLALGPDYAGNIQFLGAVSAIAASLPAAVLTALWAWGGR